MKKGKCRTLPEDQAGHLEHEIDPEQHVVARVALHSQDHRGKKPEEQERSSKEQGKRRDKPSLQKGDVNCPSTLRSCAHRRPYALHGSNPFDAAAFSIPPMTVRMNRSQGARASTRLRAASAWAHNLSSGVC